MPRVQEARPAKVRVDHLFREWHSEDAPSVSPRGLTEGGVPHLLLKPLRLQWNGTVSLWRPLF